MTNTRSKVKGMRAKKFIGKGNIWQPCHENFVDACPPETEIITVCEPVDVVFVIGAGNDGGFSTSAWGILQTRIKEFADRLDTNSDDYRLKLISIGDFGNVVIEEAFGSNNAVSFKTSVDGITESAAIKTSRDVNGGMQDAVNSSWRAEARKVVFLVDDHTPGGDNDTYSLIDENELIDTALTANTLEITLNLIGYTSFPTSRGSAHQDEIDRIYGLTSSAANDGTYNAIWTTGGIDFPSIFNTAYEGLCNQELQSTDPYNTDLHAACCKTAVCTLCLLFECYGQEDLIGTATWNGSAYEGTFDGHDFLAYWVKDGYGKCEFDIYIDDEYKHSIPLCPEYGEDGTSCRAPKGEFPLTVVDGYESCTGVFSFYTYMPKRLLRNKPVKSECQIDVAILMDVEFRMGNGALEDIQSNELESFVDDIIASADSSRFALVKFGRDASSTVQEFTSDKSTFLTAIDGLTTESDDDGVTSDQARDSDGALTLTQAFDWRSAANKIVILVSSGNPGIHNPLDVGSGNPEELSQYASATSLFNQGIEVHTISVAVGATAGIFNPRCQEVNAQTANLGGGSTQSVNQDGSADNNGGVNELAPAITGLAPQVLCQEGKCTTHYCGDCDCVPERLCVNVYAGINDTAFIILDWAGAGECEFGWRKAAWSNEESYLELISDEYEECRLQGTIVSGDTTLDVDEVITDCKNLSAFPVGGYGNEGVGADISPLVCDICQQIGTLDCCDFAVLGKNCPETLTAYFCGGEIDLTQQAAGTCDFWDSSGIVGGQQIDISMTCNDTGTSGDGQTQQNPNVDGDYELELNCNALGPNPLFSWAKFISCGPDLFVVTFDLPFNCLGICDGYTDEDGNIQVVIVGTLTDLAPGGP